MNKSEIVKELNTLRLVLNDLIGDTDIGEHYIDVLGKSLFLVGSSKWEYSSDHFTIKCDEIACNVNVSIYHKDILMEEHSYNVDSIISDEDSAEA